MSYWFGNRVCLLFLQITALQTELQVQSKALEVRTCTYMCIIFVCTVDLEIFV